ncbi:hypothetical protein HmCmsJML020_01633 [Escherichia coli]|nr:hypothetical protein HmCmsJML020_01633 [Escherichia coli]
MQRSCNWIIIHLPHTPSTTNVTHSPGKQPKVLSSIRPHPPNPPTRLPTHPPHYYNPPTNDNPTLLHTPHNRPPPPPPTPLLPPPPPLPPPFQIAWVLSHGELPVPRLRTAAAWWDWTFEAGRPKKGGPQSERGPANLAIPRQYGLKPDVNQDVSGGDAPATASL